ncbi:RNA-directed DNA polymerase, eukaryota, reverse transcriptase zinc-binding domain protein [Tanacetum coccineum]
MGSFRSKEDDVAKISTSIFVFSNYSISVSAKDLFHSCKQYGHVVDSFIPMKRLKDGKRFGFVRFINVNPDQKMGNKIQDANQKKHEGRKNTFYDPAKRQVEREDNRNSDGAKTNSTVQGNSRNSWKILLGEIQMLMRNLVVIVITRLEILGKLQQVNKAQASEVAQKAKIKWNSFTLSKQQKDLECMVSKEEVKRAVWDCGTDKSPGPDGFTFGFYRHFWSTIENDVFEAIKYLFFHIVNEAHNKISEIELATESRDLEEDETECVSNAYKTIFELEKLKMKDFKQKDKLKWAVDGDENTMPPFKSDRFLKLSELQRETLECPFSKEEIKNSVWRCGGDKAPGPHGFTFDYIKKYWNVIGDDIMNAVIHFYSSAFIPKGAERLKMIIPSIISDVQMAYVEGRNILSDTVTGATTGTPVNGGQQWRSMVVSDAQQRQSTTVNRGAPPLTTSGPPSDHRSTVVDRQSTVGYGFGSGRVATCRQLSGATWHEVYNSHLKQAWGSNLRPCGCNP